MADEHELQHLPRPESSSMVTSETRSSLIARGRKDAAGLMVRKSGPELVAAVRLEKKWGFIADTGVFVVEPVHYGLCQFACGLARFSASPPVLQYPHFSPKSKGRYDRLNLFNAGRGRLGYLGSKGEVIIPPTFDSARNFSEDLAGVEFNGKWGFINRDGTFAVVPSFTGVRDFKDGLAIAKLSSKCGFVDRFGKFAIEPRFDYLWEFSEGLACAEINEKYGYLDRSGAFAIKPQYDSAFDFRWGVARVKVNGRECLIDRSENIIFQCSDNGESVYGVADGIAIVSKGDGASYRGYYLDIKGHPILKDDSLNAKLGFSEGLGVVCKSQDGYPCYGYVDATGQVRISPQFKMARPFKEGVALIVPRGGRRHGFINKNGELVIESKFTRAEDFKKGMARIRDDNQDMPVGMGNGKWGFIDNVGNVVIPCQFDEAKDFEAVTI